MHLAILGPMAVGKTSVGTRVAAQLGLPWFDSDDQIREEHGETGRAIVAREGVAALHRVELEMLVQALSAAPAVVVSPAASVVDVEDGRAELARDDVCCVLLLADLDIIQRRLSADDHRRLMSAEELQRLHRRRVPIWQDLAAGVFRTDHRGPDAVADDVAALYRARAGRAPRPAQAPRRGGQ